jgi:hypothetical protein
MPLALLAAHLVPAKVNVFGVYTGVSSSGKCKNIY